MPTRHTTSFPARIAAQDVTPRRPYSSPAASAAGDAVEMRHRVRWVSSKSGVAQHRVGEGGVGGQCGCPGEADHRRLRLPPSSAHRLAAFGAAPCRVGRRPAPSVSRTCSFACSTTLSGHILESVIEEAKRAICVCVQSSHRQSLLVYLRENPACALDDRQVDASTRPR